MIPGLYPQSKSFITVTKTPEPHSAMFSILLIVAENLCNIKLSVLSGTGLNHLLNGFLHF
jgi:hypothetical protein